MNEITKELLEALKACLKKGARWHPADPVVLGAISAIAKAEAALAEPQAAADGWIPWSGGECPIPEGMAFDLRFRDGAKLIAASSDWPTAEWDWSCESGPYGIVAYRIVKESGK